MLSQRRTPAEIVKNRLDEIAIAYDKKRLAARLICANEIAAIDECERHAVYVARAELAEPPLSTP